MRSFTRHRSPRQRVSWSSTIDDMSSLRPCSSTSSSGRRDTGFPEPFNGDRNTTLPHPEANLSPTATLGEEDIAPERALMRARNSFLKDPNSSPNNAEGFMDGIKSFERMARAVRGDVSKKPSDNGATWANATATTPTKDSDSVMSTSSNGSGPRQLETPSVNRAQPLFPPDSPDSKKSTKSAGKRAWFARNILGRSP